MEKLDKILEELTQIKVSQAVTHERLKESIKDGTEMAKEIRVLQKRIDKQDKIFGAVSMFAVILTVVFGLILNSQRVISSIDRPKNEVKKVQKIQKKHN